jgi:Lrp/AsnC family transcriptional regulator
MGNWGMFHGRGKIEMAVRLDELDRKILVQLQRDGGQSLDEIAKVVGSSKTPVGSRRVSSS